MLIDFNPKECEAMAAYKRCDQAMGDTLQDEFLAQIKQFRKEGGDYCSCPADCKHHGNCFECVQIHRGHGDHLPYCMHKALNKKLAMLSELTEHSIVKEVNSLPTLLGK